MNKRCNDVIHEAHINTGSYSGFKNKSDISVPLCAIHHAHQHNIGEKTFWGHKLEAAKNAGIEIREAQNKHEALLAIARFKR